MATQAPAQGPRAWWQQPIYWGGGGGVVVLVAVLLVVLLVPGPGNGFQPVSSPTTVPASVLSAVTNPGTSLFDTVGEGSAQTEDPAGQLSRLTGTNSLTDSAGKTEVVYVGAEYCPYCAAERWSMIMALSRFGTFTGLKEMSSSSSDTDPSTSSFTFVDSSYTSQWVDFMPVEEQDQNQNPLQTPSASVEQIFTTYDQVPYSASAAGQPGFPFLDIGGSSVLYQTSFDPAILQGLSWKQIATDFASTGSPVTRAIVGNANFLAAAICIADGNQPSSVCSSSTIEGIETLLKAQPTIGS